MIESLIDGLWRGIIQNKRDFLTNLLHHFTVILFAHK